MRKIRRLIQKAKEAAGTRGHRLERFRHLDSFRRAITFCSVCGDYVQVVAKPMPNEIDIGGSAVALTCRRLVCLEN